MKGSSTASDLRLFGTVQESITDGPGLRTAVFVQGCPHHCEGCHNPGSHDFEGGIITGIDEIFARIQRNPLLSGVTFSGGEPMCQALPLSALALRCRTIGLDIAVYTGYVFEELISENDPDRMALLRVTDTLIDGRFVLSKHSHSLRFRGSSNQRILDVNASLLAGAPVEVTASRWL